MCPIVANRCGACDECSGEEKFRHYCGQVRPRGVHTDGNFAEYHLVSQLGSRARENICVC